jgi:predicted metal-dependent hydrolase
VVDDIPYAVRRSARARTVRVTVAPDAGVEVVLPVRAGRREAAAAVRELRPWIERRLRELDAARAAVAVPEGCVPYLGDALRVRSEEGRRRAHRRGADLLVPADGADAALERWYRRAAREEIGARLERAAARAGAGYATLAIRGQRTRWGSCSAAGAMSFNWRLLLAPAPVAARAPLPGVPRAAPLAAPLRLGARAAGAAERPAKRRVGRLAVALLDQPPADASGPRLHRAVATDVHASPGRREQTAGARDLQPRRHLGDRLEAADPEVHAGSPTRHRHRPRASLERFERRLQRGKGRPADSRALSDGQAKAAGHPAGGAGTASAARRGWCPRAAA